MDGSDPREWLGHVIVCGLEGLGVRVVELLQSAGIRVSIVGTETQDQHLRAVQALSVPRIAGSPRNPDSLWAAGLAGALCVVCVEDDDLRCLESALLVQELAPQTRVIVRQSNAAVGRAVKSAIPRGLVVNPADLAAPTFVESVLDERLHRLQVAGDDYVVRELEMTRSGRLLDLFGELAPIVVMHPDGSQAVCPSREYYVHEHDQVALVGSETELMNLTDVPAEVLGVPAKPHGSTRHPLQALAHTLSYGSNNALIWTLGALFAVGVAFAIILILGYVDAPGGGMDTVDAFYFAVETLTTVGYGDFAFDAQPGYLRVIAILVMITAALLMAFLYAVVTEFLVSRRIAATFGLLRVTGMSAHVIVVGLGSLGVAVVERLVEMGQQVVVVERDSSNRHIGRARALGVPVIAADATQPQTLLSANLPVAQGVAVLTSDEYANLETGLAVRDSLAERATDVPVVMRVFDRRLAAMLEQRLHFHHVRSVSAVSAPWFVSAALGLDVIATFAVDQQAFIAGRLTVRAEGGLAGMSMLDLPMRARVIALTRKDGLEHLPRSQTKLQAGDDAYVVGPPEDLLSLLMHNRSVNPVV
ncbi:MAG: NAD-binding protein [Candidatus Nanopelagicales bacterium]